MKPDVRLVMHDTFVRVYLNDQLFDEAPTIARLDILGLLKAVGCRVTKVDAPKPSKTKR